ncbi:uncharacterized protein [Palaemon carinicauda]|uniref:uncharacterized protein isoform X2 n=1 Tax=Palaemon carinicauda TaxID=392227 RepID=UPI0035B603FF
MTKLLFLYLMLLAWEVKGQNITSTESPSVEGQTVTSIESPSVKGQTVTSIESPSVKGQTDTSTESPSIKGQTDTSTESPSIEGQTVTSSESPSVKGQTDSSTFSPSTSIPLGVIENQENQTISAVHSPVKSILLNDFPKRELKNGSFTHRNEEGTLDSEISSALPSHNLSHANSHEQLLSTSSTVNHQSFEAPSNESKSVSTLPALNIEQEERPQSDGIMGEEVTNTTSNSTTDDRMQTEKVELGKENFIRESSENPMKNQTLKNDDNKRIGSFNESIAKSIEIGNIKKNDFHTSSENESRSSTFDKPDDMTLDKGENTKFRDENSTIEAHVLSEGNVNHSEGDFDNDDSQESDITREDLVVRKCCEDHQYFSLETNQCEEAVHDLGFIKIIRDIFLPDSVVNVKTLNGLLPTCPGTTDPPHISEPNNYTHSVEVSGYVTDMILGLTYDHNQYCLELADSPDLHAPVLVLAHCPQTSKSEKEDIIESPIPVPTKIRDTKLKEVPGNLKTDQSEMNSNKTQDEFLVRKCCEDHEFFSLTTQQCEDARDVDFKYFVHKTLLQNSTSFETLNGRIPLCPGTTYPPHVSEASSDTHIIGAFGHLSDVSSGMKYDHDHYCLELAAQNLEDLQVPLLILAYCLPTGKETLSEPVIKTTVRKCCKEHEFFSIRSQACEPAGGDPGFLNNIREKISSNNSSLEFQPITGLLKECPGSGEPPKIDEVASYSHTLLLDGHLKDRSTSVIYNQDHYCLELAASSHDLLVKAPIVLAHCMPEEKENYKIPPSEIIVRKCCADDEYFSTRSQKCELSETNTGFEDSVRTILTSNFTNDLSYLNGMIHWCPSSRDLPDVTKVLPQTHTVSAFGHLKELRSGVRYDHENYCLELAADSPNELYNAEFVASYCPIFNAHILIRKCCNLNQYIDSDSLECLDRLGNMSNYNYLMKEFHHSDPVSTTITVGKLKCKNGVMNRIDADSTYLDEAGQLCEHSNGICHPSSAYCIEHFGKSTDTVLESGAFVCPTNVFNKCCPLDEELSDNGCIKHDSEHIASSYMNQLMEILLPQVGLPTIGEKICDSVLIRSSERDIRWWVSKAGYLSLRSNYGKTTTKHYCVDDYKTSENRKETKAVTCINEVDHVLTTEFLSRQGKANDIGKCCPPGQYMSEDYTCITNTLGIDLLEEQEFVAANVTKLKFRSFPVCQSDTEQQGLHLYPFGQRSDDDYAILQEDQTMTIVSLENGCYLNKQTVRNTAYCIDHVVTKGNKEAMILVCPDMWQEFSTYQEKYSLTAVLLGISCTALTATAFSLISMRVRRGLVTVKKVNTLAGRILLSYVLSYLLAFLLLAIGMKATTEAGNSCYVLAGFLMFFLLAAFQWNTSICLESLLLTLRVSTSERNRYLCHSVWAWGIPGIITTIALTLDHHRADLPCSVITPKIGLYRCFFSDSFAQLLYLYFPMFVSLCANMILLLGARYVRSANLRRLEKGGRAQNTTANLEEAQEQQNKTSDQNTSQVSSQPNGQHSGLRTHQNRNLWIESMKLVVWSGVTWMAEVLAFLVTRFIGLSESWYNYLWYLPSSINSLRGVGIFVILVLTPENRHKIFKMVGNFGSWAGSGSLARHSRSGDGHSTSGNHQSSITQGRGSEARAAGRRNMSIATTLTNISSVRSGTSTEMRHETGTTIRVHPNVAQSVSQIDTRRGSGSSQSSDGENSESDPEYSGGRRRKSSAANFALVSLPSVDEEEDVFDGTSNEPHTPIISTMSTSDV